MPFDAFLAAKLHLLEGLDPTCLDVETAKRWDEFQRDPAPWTFPENVAMDDIVALGTHGPISCRRYTPRRATGSVLVWAHGGGFSAGDLDMPEAHVVSAELAARSRATVVSVGYRLADGQIRYPWPIDDVAAVWDAVARGELANQDQPRKVCLGGASAGGALALAVALRLRDGGHTQPAALLLAYPFAHFPNPALDFEVSAMMAPLPPALRFTPASVEAMVRTYVGRISDVPPDALPGAAPLRGLPPAHVLISEYDDLRSSAELLARQLAEAGVTVQCTLAAGMPHGHLNRTPALAEVARSLDIFAAALQE
ncbi:alpha/beta hydrolase fold domain-containing protein [Pedococcus sp. 5OH_020]|uniref:alpha/beta hydrolase fold domain-containing protein n=1 Tax=Pedococcus sp. 5OH_020 TaxID=2989814 RepID=UPI0022E9FB5C|nr:alpha/beta hydrolase fold domain-containing protein [Pedococcus sp. 5OH_020]